MLIVLLSTFSLRAATADTAPRVTILDGIPLFQGLQISTEKKLTDLLPASDFTISVAAIGAVNSDDVYAFYKRALPVLGWKPVGSRDFIKGMEKLDINAYAGATGSVVLFSEEIDAN
jgi:hypothetical protein